MVSMFKKRVLAYLIDWFVIFAILNILAWIVQNSIEILFSIHILNYFIYLLPIFIIFYFVYLEKKKGKTIGKDILDLKVVSEDGGNITYREAIIRNLSKLYWIPIIFDLIIGRNVGESKERILGQWSKTMVVEVENLREESEESDDTEELEKDEKSVDGDESEELDDSVDGDESEEFDDSVDGDESEELEKPIE
ncbi:MAG: RDD family protein [Methanobrevibacter sp.]|nr:RDD family protein [Methanobrevibacter sp.]